MESNFFDKSYYESGPQSGKSLYQNFRWMPELTIPLAHHIADYMNIYYDHTIMDYGCAKGYLVKAFRLLGYTAYGTDVSKYAISQADKEVDHNLSLIEPGSGAFPSTDHLIAKDVLEHIPYDSIDSTLEIIRNKCGKVFAIIPLAEDGKYIVPAYEFDKSHFIRENKDWWQDKFKQAGFTKIHATTDLGPFKANWTEQWPDGNLLVIGE